MHLAANVAWKRDSKILLIDLMVVLVMLSGTWLIPDVSGTATWRVCVSVCVSFFSFRWSQNLAEQISPWRPKLPGGCKLCVCAHWPLLKRATAGLLLNVRHRGPQLPPPCTGAGALCYMKSELGTLTLFTVLKIIGIRVRLKSSASPRLHSFLFFLSFFFGALKACKKNIKIKASILNKLKLECMTSVTDWIISYWHF